MDTHSDLYTIDPKSHGTKGLVYIGDKLLVYRRDTNTDVYPLCINLPGSRSCRKELETTSR